MEYKILTNSTIKHVEKSFIFLVIICQMTNAMYTIQLTIPDSECYSLCPLHKLVRMYCRAVSTFAPVLDIFLKQFVWEET
jgi:hypothetical protein